MKKKNRIIIKFENIKNKNLLNDKIKNKSKAYKSVKDKN
jgi:hypothetical protein